MYGSGTPPLAGGIIGTGTLATTGADPAWWLALAAATLLISGALTLRHNWTRKHQQA